MLRWLIAFLLLLGCAPYVPLQEPPGSRNKLIEADSPDAVMRLQHLRNQFGHFVFDFEVINQGQHELSISPHHDIFYYGSPKPFPNYDRLTDVRSVSIANSHLLTKQLYAEECSIIIDKVNQQIKSRATAQTIFMLIGVGLAVYDGVKDAKDNRKEKWTYNDANKAAGRNALVQTAFTSSDIAGASAASAAEESFYLPSELFPDVTLQPGEQKRGKLFLPIETNYRFLRIIVSADQIDYVFDFKKEGTQKINN